MANLATISNNILADSGIDSISVVTGSGTANQIAYWSSGSAIGSLTTATYPSLTELSYVKGVTSAIQTQLNAKQATLTLTTTGTSGAATLVGATLNIPQYQSVITNPVTGTGTQNYVTKWNNAGGTSIGNSLIYDDGTNVGINTASPNQLLDVRKNQNTDTVIQVYNANTGGGATAQIYLNNGTTYSQLYHTGTNFTPGGAIVPNQGGFYTISSAGLAIVANNATGVIRFATGSTTEKMRLDASGYLGIGTGSPTFPLTINKTGVVETGNAYGIAQFRDASANKGVDLGYDNTSQTGIILSGTTATASELAFWTYTGSSWGERMRITSGGTLQLNTQSTYGSMTYEPSITYTRTGQTGVGGIYFGNSFNSNNNVAMQLRVSNDGTQVQAVTIAPTGQTTFSSSIASSSIAVVKNTSTTGYSSIDFQKSDGTQLGTVGCGNASSSPANVQNQMYLYGVSGIAFLTNSSSLSTKMYLKDTGQLQLNNYTSSSSFTGTAAGVLAFDSSGNVITQSATLYPSGSGTTNYVARWTGANTLGTGVIQDNGTTVGIGAAPDAGARLYVYRGAGDAYITAESGAGSYTYLELRTPSSGTGYLIKNISTGNSALNKSLYLWNSTGAIQFVPDGTIGVALTVDTSGSVGIRGTQPAAWASGTEGALQLKNAGIYGYSDYEAGITANTYYSSGWKRIGANTASMIYVSTDVQIRTAVSSTAGSAITWVTPISIANTGEVSFTAIARSWSYNSPSTNYMNIDWGGGGVLYRDSYDSYLVSNCYYSTAGWKAKYSYADGMAIIRMVGGDFAWHTYNGSVTAGTVYGLTDKFYITKAGNVGIGATSFPAGDALLIENSGVWNVTIGLNNTGTGGRKWNIFSTNSTFAQGAGKLLFYNATGGSDAMVIDSSNNVGIGMTSPSYRLEVNGVVTATNIYPYNTTYKTTNFLDFYPGNDNVLFFHAGTSWGDPGIFVNGTTAGTTISGALANQFILRGDGAGGIGFSNGSSINMILKGGLLGIATNSPAYKLDITALGYGIQHYGNASNYLRTYCGSGYQIIESNGADQFGYFGGNFYVQTAGTDRMRINSSGDLLLKGRSTTANYDAVFYNDNSQLAINATNTSTGKTINFNPSSTYNALSISSTGVFTFNGAPGTYTYNFASGSMYIPGGQSGNSSAAYTAWNQLVFGDQYSDVARGPNKIVTYGRGSGWVGGIGIHNDTQAYYAGGTHKFYKFDGTTATLNLSLDGSGNLTATGGFFEGSDMRIKTLIENNYVDMSILEVSAKLYEKHGKKELGYFAQDFESLLPTALSVNENGFYDLSYRQVHTAKIAALEQKIKELEQQLKNK